MLLLICILVAGLGLLDILVGSLMVAGGLLLGIGRLVGRLVAGGR